MSELSSRLSSKRIPVEQLLLDPNNPRLLDVTEERRNVPESHYANQNVQESTLSKLRSGDFDIIELQRSIEKIGFVPVDKIVVRDLENGYYVVIEGNRRIAAIKSLLEDYEAGLLETVPTERIDSVRELDVLVLSKDGADGAEQQVREQWLVMGLRHLSGTKSWGPYQQARAIEALLAQGYSHKDAAQSLGMRVGTVTTLVRSLKSLEAMKRNDEFEEFAEPRMFSYFHEIQKLNSLKEWLDWSDENETFENSTRLAEFYSWITDQPDGNGGKHKRVPRAIDLRDLAAIVANDSSLAAFRDGKDLEQSRRLIPTNMMLLNEWKEEVGAATKALLELPANVLEALTDEDRDLLQELQELISRRLEQREAILAEVGAQAPSD